MAHSHFRSGVMVAAALGIAGVLMAQPQEKPAAKPQAPAAPAPKAEAPVAAPKQGTPPGSPKEESAPVSPYVLGYTVKTIDGKEQDLAAYKGKVVVIVNVASKCGYTTQYEGLETLYESKKADGLVV